jgi:hypothetical protein
VQQEKSCAQGGLAIAMQSLSRHHDVPVSGIAHDHVAFHRRRRGRDLWLFVWRYETTTGGTGGIVKLLHDRLLLMRLRHRELSKREIESQ